VYGIRRCGQTYQRQSRGGCEGGGVVGHADGGVDGDRAWDGQAMTTAVMAVMTVMNIPAMSEIHVSPAEKSISVHYVRDAHASDDNAKVMTVSLMTASVITVSVKTV
jgi:hypothetical protein